MHLARARVLSARSDPFPPVFSPAAMYAARTAINKNFDPIQTVEKNKILRDWILAKFPIPGRQFTYLSGEVFYPAFPGRAGPSRARRTEREGQWNANRKTRRSLNATRKKETRDT